MSTTAERLHAIADALEDRFGRRFICFTGEDLFGEMWRFGVLEPLLIEGGIESMDGDLIRQPSLASQDYYRKEGMNLRFMYLEFLALMLESEA